MALPCDVWSPAAEVSLRAPPDTCFTSHLLLTKPVLEVCLVVGAGTVCVLSESSAAGEAAVQRVVERYAKSMGGYRATVR